MTLPKMTARALMAALRADAAHLRELGRIAPARWAARISARHRCEMWEARIAFDLTGSGEIEDFKLDDAQAAWLRSACEAIGSRLDATRRRPTSLPEEAAASLYALWLDARHAADLAFGGVPGSMGRRSEAYRAYHRRLADLKFGFTRDCASGGGVDLADRLHEEFRATDMAAAAEA